MKFDPRYTLGIEVAGDQKIELTLPLTVEFEIQRRFLGSLNSASFRVYNLGDKTRNLIYQDRFDWSLPGNHRAIQFRAGYKDETPALVFNGTVRWAYSYRRGTDMITEIEAFDGGLQTVNGFTSQTVGAGAVASDVIAQLAATLPGSAGPAIVGAFNAITKRGEVLFGNTWDLIQQKAGGLASIDNGQVKALGNNEAIAGEIPVIDAATGLLESPRRANALLEIEMLFEPRLTIGQLIELHSATNPIFNGRYKVMGFAHTGTISGSVGGERRTSASLWLGTETLRVISGNPVQ